MMLQRNAYAVRSGLPSFRRRRLTSEPPAAQDALTAVIDAAAAAGARLIYLLTGGRTADLATGR